MITFDVNTYVSRWAGGTCGPAALQAYPPGRTLGLVLLCAIYILSFVFSWGTTHFDNIMICLFVPGTYIQYMKLQQGVPGFGVSMSFISLRRLSNSSAASAKCVILLLVFEVSNLV